MTIETFNPVIWSAQLLVNLRKNLVYADPEVINRDYEGEIAGMGSQVRIHSIGAVTISTYSKNTDMAAPQALQDSETLLVIDQAKMFNFQVDSIDKAQQNP